VIKKQETIISMLVITALALIVMISAQHWFRLDITGEKIYTISEVSRNLHKEIPDRVRITYYISNKLKNMNPVPGEIEDLLREYAAYSRGKIRLSVRDPAKAKLIDKMEEMGIMPQHVETVEQDQTNLVTVYSGIVIEHLDKVDALPLVFSPETLEYDLTSSIRALVRDRPRQLGVIVGENPRRWNEDYRSLQSVLTQAGYRLRLIDPGDEIPESVLALLVFGGVESFDDTVLYRIDRYIQTGGKVLFATKSLMVDRNRNMLCRPLYDRGLLEMLASYGVTVLPEMAMDRSALSMRYQYRTPSGTVQSRVIRNPQWVRILRENVNLEHPVGIRFSGLDMFYASPITINPPEGVEAEVLFTSTNEAWSMEEPFFINPEIGDIVWERDIDGTRGVKNLGASLTGVFPSWFEGRPKPFWGYGDELPDMPDEASPARIIVVGDTDFVSSSYLGITGGQQNLGFVVQATDWLTNDDDIIGIRDKETRSGRLDRIINPGKKVSAMRTAQAVNVFLVPLLVILAGISHALSRRRLRGDV
jgi:gliding-associated putative ABC transporter substrate-binding component GldG